MLQREILTVEEVAALMKVSERTVYEWAQKGKIPCGKLGSAWRFKRSEIDKWIDERLGKQDSHGTTAVRNNNSIIHPEQIHFMDHSKKTNVINDLARSLADVLDSVDPHELAAEILKREALMSTGIGMGIGVPHVRLPAIRTLKMAIGIVPKGIADYESIDDVAINLVFMIVAGEDQHAEYLKLLSKVSAHLKDEDFRKRILTASDREAAYDLISKIAG